MEEIINEVTSLIKSIDVYEEGERFHSNYQKVVAIALRLQELHNEIALLEIRGKASSDLKKVRTMIIDPTIERLDKVASYESRKISARQLERDLEK